MFGIKKLQEEINKLTNYNNCHCEKIENLTRDIKYISYKMDWLDAEKMKKLLDEIKERLDLFESNSKRFEVMFNEVKGMVSIIRGNIVKSPEFLKKPKNSEKSETKAEMS